MTQEIIIEAGRADRHYWRDLWRYRELFRVLTWRDVAVRYKQTVIGAAWGLPVWVSDMQTPSWAGRDRMVAESSIASPATPVGLPFSGERRSGRALGFVESRRERQQVHRLT